MNKEILKELCESIEPKDITNIEDYSYKEHHECLLKNCIRPAEWFVAAGVGICDVCYHKAKELKEVQDEKELKVFEAVHKCIKEVKDNE